jgi:hypothetical protein
VVAAPKIMRDDKGKTAGICREKRKEIRWRMQLQSLIFLIRCGKTPVIYDDPTPLFSSQYPSSIQSLIYHFSIQSLVQKKSFESVPRTWAKSFSRQNSLPSR